MGKKTSIYLDADTLARLDMRCEGKWVLRDAKGYGKGGLARTTQQIVMDLDLCHAVLRAGRRELAGVFTMAELELIHEATRGSAISKSPGITATSGLEQVVEDAIKIDTLDKKLEVSSSSVLGKLCFLPASTMATLVDILIDIERRDPAKSKEYRAAVFQSLAEK